MLFVQKGEQLKKKGLARQLSVFAFICFFHLIKKTYVS